VAASLLATAACIGLRQLTPHAHPDDIAGAFDLLLSTITSEPVH
jgi:hypothetical protein